MAYQAKKQEHFQEDLELVNCKGEVVHTLHVELDADDMVAKINRKYNALTRALVDAEEIKKVNKNGKHLQEAVEKLGTAELDLFEAVFGEEDTKTIVKFYEGRYIEMAKEIIPFITTVVMPRIAEIRKENKRALISQYNRVQRRKLFKW